MVSLTQIVIFIVYINKYLFLGFFDHGQKYTAESRCGDQKNVKVLLKHNPSGGNYIEDLKDGRKEYFSTNVVYSEIFPLARNKF